MPWRLALVCAALCFAAGGLYGYSALAPALAEAFSSGAEQSGLVFSVAIIAFSAAVLVAPRLPLSLRGLPGAALAGFAGAIALMFAINATSFSMFIFAYGVGFGISSGAIYILCMEIAGRFTNSRAMTAFLVASFGFGGVVFGPVQRLLIAAGFGLSALLALAGALVAASLAGLLLHNSRASRFTRTQELHTSAPPSSEVPAGPGLGARTVFLLWCGFGLASVAGLMVLGQATTIIETRGGTIWLSSLAIFSIAMGNSLGRLSTAIVERIMPLGRLVPAAPFVSILGLVLSLVSTSPMWTSLGLSAIAFGYGLAAASFPILTHKFAGPHHFARTYSIVFSAWGLAGLLSPWLAGRAYDATGSFVLPLSLALLCSLGALVIALALVRHLPYSRNPT